MAFSEKLAERIRNGLFRKKVPYEEKKMMGGLCFMVDDKMCPGLLQDKKTGEDLLMARIGPDEYENALLQPGCRPMDFTGRPMKGMVFVENSVIQKSTELKRWIDLCLAYNPEAKRSKSGKRKA